MMILALGVVPHLIYMPLVRDAYFQSKHLCSFDELIFLQTLCENVEVSYMSDIVRNSLLKKDSQKKLLNKGKK